MTNDTQAKKTSSDDPRFEERLEAIMDELDDAQEVAAAAYVAMAIDCLKRH